MALFRRNVPDRFTEVVIKKFLVSNYGELGNKLEKIKLKKNGIWFKFESYDKKELNNFKNDFCNHIVSVNKYENCCDVWSYNVCELTINSYNFFSKLIEWL
jgi:hypothetical protein